MQIIKGTLLNVKHQRKGKFIGVAIDDFDAEKTEFYPIAVFNGFVKGLNNEWGEGESIPCKRDLCTISVKEAE